MVCLHRDTICGVAAATVLQEHERKVGRDPPPSGLGTCHQLLPNRQIRHCRELPARNCLGNPFQRHHHQHRSISVASLYLHNRHLSNLTLLRTLAHLLVRFGLGFNSHLPARTDHKGKAKKRK